MVNHNVIRMIFALAIGVFLALFSYQRFTEQEPGLERSMEEAAVMAGREILREFVAVEDEIEIIDPLAPSRVIGKVYIYPADSGWELSGFYRRNRGDRNDRWHPYLMSLDAGLMLISLSVKDTDAQLIATAAGDPRFSVDP
ncbi:MAG: hypothetical protein DRR11_13535 [Gammaproteobacteria bacterium]|nr:MAG: hypothetical protein DRR11_13535 [Gammaproteobacteria bacterium]